MTLLTAVLSTVVSSVTMALDDPVPVHRPGCQHLYTVAQGERPARYIYRGTRHVTLANYHTLGRMEMCQRHKRRDQPLVRSYNRRLGAEHRARVIAARTVWQSAVASWYDDSGVTGCGFHAAYGIATFVVGCGGTVTLRGPGGRVVRATRDDSGPYVSGRTFDLDPVTRDALGCGDLCQVDWSIEST